MVNSIGKTDKDNIIEIRLDKDTNLFIDSEIVHKNEYELVCETIQNYLGTIDNSNISEDIDNYKYKTILINGERGSGKTSFLYSVRNYFIKEYENKELYVLPFLDPTLMEEKAHILLTIISFITKAVEDKFNGSCDYIGKKRDWTSRLEQLSKGLPILDGLSESAPEYWDDSFMIMHKGLEDVSAAYSLRKNLNLFLNESLQILGAKAFLLIIDDVDTDFTKAWPIMEMLRKYICNQKIITVVSGDFNLFSYATRKQQWKNFGKPLLKNEYDDKTFQHNTEYKNQVLELENQYLKKIFPVNNRIYLTNIRYLLENHKKNIVIKQTKNSEDKKIEDFYNDVLRDFGIINPYQRAAYRNYIEILPLRTQIQFIQIFANINSERKISLIKLFNTELQYYNIDSNLIISNTNYLTIELLKFLTTTDKLFNFYQLEPISNENIENAVLLCFSLLFSNEIKDNYSLIFNYLIRICYLRNIYEYIDNNDKLFNFENLIQHCNLYSDNDLRQITCYITSFLRSVYYKTKKKNARKDSFDGIISLTGFASVAKRGSEKKLDAFDSVVKTIQNPIKRYIASMPLSSDTIPSSNGTIKEYSFYTLLSSISDVISECKESGIDSIFIIISKYTNIRQYPLLIDLNNGFDGTDEEEDSADEEKIAEEVEPEKKDDSQELIIVFKEWLEYLSNIKISSYVLAKIFTRTFYVVRNITEKNVKRKQLGEIMHLFICALLNSCIIEENLETYRFTVRKDNIATSDRYFGDNLKNMSENENIKDEYPIFSMFVNCPFLTCFLKLDSDAMPPLEKCMNKTIYNYIKKINLYEDLNKITTFEMMNIQSGSSK